MSPCSWARMRLSPRMSSTMSTRLGVRPQWLLVPAPRIRIDCRASDARLSAAATSSAVDGDIHRGSGRVFRGVEGSGFSGIRINKLRRLSTGGREPFPRRESVASFYMDLRSYRWVRNDSRPPVEKWRPRETVPDPLWKTYTVPDPPVHNRSARPAASTGCWRYGPGTSPHRRGVGKTLPGLQRPEGSNAARTRCISARSSGANIVGMYWDLSAPMPCSPVSDPPASMQYD